MCVYSTWIDPKRLKIIYPLIFNDVVLLFAFSVTIERRTHKHTQRLSGKHLGHRAQGLNEHLNSWFYSNANVGIMKFQESIVPVFDVWMVKMCNVHDAKCILCFIKAAWRHLMLLFHIDREKERTNFRFKSIIGYFQICQWVFWSVIAKDGETSLWFYDVLMYLCTECMVPSFCFAFFFFALVPFECESTSQTEWYNKITFYIQ